MRRRAARVRTVGGRTPSSPTDSFIVRGRPGGLMRQILGAIAASAPALLAIAGVLLIGAVR